MLRSWWKGISSHRDKLKTLKRAPPQRSKHRPIWFREGWTMNEVSRNWEIPHSGLKERSSRHDRWTEMRPCYNPVCCKMQACLSRSQSLLLCRREKASLPDRTGEADSAFEASEYKLSLQVTESPLSVRQGSLLSGRRLRHQTQPRQPEKDWNPGKKPWGGAERGTPDTGARMICGCQGSLVFMKV